MSHTKEYYVIDDLISGEECIHIYNELLCSPNWSLNRQSKSVGPFPLPTNSFPGLVVEHKGEVMNPYFSGYFRGLVFQVRRRLEQDHKISLPLDIYRMHLGAKNSHSKTDFHKDHNDPNAWSILGFLNPVWNTGDGGEFYIEKEKIEYKTARFIVFKSNLMHNGGYVKNETLSYWRVSLNVILLNQSDSKEQ